MVSSGLENNMSTSLIYWSLFFLFISLYFKQCGHHNDIYGIYVQAMVPQQRVLNTLHKCLYAMIDINLCHRIGHNLRQMGYISYAESEYPNHQNLCFQRKYPHWTNYMFFRKQIVGSKIELMSQGRNMKIVSSLKTTNKFTFHRWVVTYKKTYLSFYVP